MSGPWTERSSQDPAPPEPAAPESTAPDFLTLDSADFGIAVPESAASESAAPESADLESAFPESTAPAPVAADPGSPAPRAEPTSPVEATLRILQSSVPYLIGSAVVRHGPVTGIIAAEIGQVPWLLDRRLTQLEFSDDALPANQPVLLDWPVPMLADWVGAPPRLLIARLVAFEKTVGVLLGTLVTREPLDPRAREAIELSCELAASAIATEVLVRASEQQSRLLRVLHDLQRALSISLDARALGRVLRETIAQVMEHVTFAVSLFHAQRPEVGYRYRVVEAEGLANELTRGAMDDGPSCRAAVRSERVLFTREIEMPYADAAGATRRLVSVVQLPLVANGETIGVVTIEAFRPDGFGDEELALAQAVIDTSANYFAHARGVGPRPQPEERRFAPASGSVAPAEEAALPQPQDPAPAFPETGERDAESILRELLAACAKLGQPHSFVVLADPGTGLLRARFVSSAPFMAEFDTAAGISRGTFVVGIDDRANAIARACREARVVSVAWVYELVQPVLNWQQALVLERLAGGGCCAVVPIRVGGEVGGALVVGPSAKEIPGETVGRVSTLADEAGRALAHGWRAASLRVVQEQHAPLS